MSIMCDMTIVTAKVIQTNYSYQVIHTDARKFFQIIKYYSVIVYFYKKPIS